MTKEELYYLSASELLKHIQAEKERLIKEKVIKKSKPLSTITDEEKLYELPEEWGWIRLGNVIHFTSEKKIDGDCLPLLDVKFFRNNKNTVLVSKGTVVDKGDLLILKDGENSGEVFKATQKGYMGSTLKKFTIAQGVNEDYILYFIRSNFAVLKGNKTGSAIPHLDFNLLNNLLLPLPPQYIQDQIVQKLEKISETKDSLLSHAESQLNYTKKIREALLQEAIRGELVPQDKNDEPTSVLLEKIKTEKERLIKEKVIKKPKELPPITDEDKPYELPNGWEWVRLDQICKVVTCGYASTPKYVEDGMPFISAKNVKPYKFMPDKYQMISRELYDKLVSGAKPEKNDILVTRVGAGIGEAAIIDKDFDFAIYVSLTLIKPFQQFISSKYLLHWFNSPHGASKSRRNTFGAGSSQGNLNVNEVRNFLIPLPPLAEQERIVAKLDELMVNCDQLEAKAEEMKNYTMKLFEASLKEAFMPE